MFFVIFVRRLNVSEIVIKNQPSKTMCQFTVTSQHFCSDLINSRFCMVVWWLASLPHSKRAPISGWGLSVCSPRVCMGSLQVLQLPPTTQKHACQVGMSHWWLYIVPRSESEYERGWLCVSFVSLWPCDGLATCPGCTLPMAQWQLISSRPLVTLNWIKRV